MLAAVFPRMWSRSLTSTTRALGIVSIAVILTQSGPLCFGSTAGSTPRSGIAHPGVVRVFAELAFGATLAQKVPALVQADLQRPQALPVFQLTSRSPGSRS